MYSNGDARSAIAQHARDSSSMPPDHTSSALWERPAFTRDKFERPERDKYASAKKDWALDNRPSSTRSSNTLFSNASYAGPPAKRRAVGRHGLIHENGRYGSAGSRSSDLAAHLRSPSENGKAERDFCGGPSPGYSSSPSTEKPSKDSDGHHFRDSNLSPSETRPSSSPRLDPPSRLYGNQSSLDGTASRERERSKFSSSPYAWDSSHRERDYRERGWGRPDYHRRTYSLPKLDSPRGWSGGDRELLEGRIDRYGTTSSRDPAFLDVLNITSKEHHRYDWRSRDRTLFSGFSSRSSAAPSSNAHILDNGSALARPEVPRVSSPPKPSATQGSASLEPHREDAGVASPKKRPRLTWGQGLAKYEKQKVEDEPSATKKSNDSHHETELFCEGVHASSPEHNQPRQNGDISPCHNNHSVHEDQHEVSGDIQGMQVERFSKSAQDVVAMCPTLGTVHEASVDEHCKDSRMGHGSLQSPSLALVQDATFAPVASHPLVLHDVQAFLESVLRERPNLSKDVLTHHVEKLEQEIEYYEKELMKLDTELSAHAPLLLAEDEGLVQKQVVISHDTSDVNSLATGALGSVSFDTSAVVQPQFLDCATLDEDTCVENLPFMHDANVHIQESFKELEVHLQEPPKEIEAMRPEHKPVSRREALDQGMVVTNGGSGNIVLSAGQPFELHGKGGHLNFEQKDAGFCASIILSNQRISEQTLRSLAHLNSPGIQRILECGRLYASPEKATIWKLNAESHTSKRKCVESKIIDEKALRRFTEVVLVAKFRAQREMWKQRQSGSHSQMDFERTPSVSQNDQRDDNNLNTQQSLLNPGTDTMSPMNDEGSLIADVKSKEGQEGQINQKLTNGNHFEKERGFLRMPAMHLGKRERDLHKFETQNGLVEDPVSAEQERKASNPWSMEEKKLFLDKYFLLGKDFRRIAAYLEHKTVADCVEFYYRNQKTEEFEKVHSRHQLMKRRDYQPSAPYLTTTISFSSRHLEGNTDSLEGLTLVAAAAAAMSVPKEYSNVSPWVGVATAGVTKPFPCALSTEGSNEERRGGKCARSSNTRPKAYTEEIDLQWSDNEKKSFVNAVVMFGKNFYSISQHVGTKSERQCKTFFSKARKSLSLDQLVERHKVILQASLAENEVATPLIRDMKGKPASCADGCLSQEQCMLEKSSPIVAPSDCARTELPQVKCHLEDAMDISPSKSMQVGHADGNLPERSVPKSVSCVNNAIKQEACTLSDNGDKSFGDGDLGTRTAINCQLNGAPLVEPLQGRSLEESLVCGEILQFKTEPVGVKVEPIIGGNISNVVCNGTLSHIPTSSPPLVSALVPSSLPVSPLIQSLHSKDQSLKTETKARREPTSWTQEEKDKFVDVLKVYGKNWDRLRENLPGKSLTQIKTYFQNSKAKLGFGVDGIVNGNGRVGSSRKRKADDSDSSSNAGSVGQNASQMVHVLTDDGSLKVSPSLFIPPVGVGSHGLSAEALMYANLFSRNSLEDSVNAQKVLHSIGLTPNTSTASIHPLLNPAVFASPNLRTSHQSFVHANVAKGQQVVGLQQPQQAASPFGVVSPMQQPIVSLGIHQTQQLQQPSPPQPAVRMLQELTLPAVQHLHKQPGLLQSEVNQQVLFQQQQQQQVVQQLQQQVTEAVLQQQLSPQHQRQQQMLAQAVPLHNFQQVLSQYQAHVNQQAQNQLPLGSCQSACSQIASVSQPISANHQLQQQSDLFQSQLYQMHAKSPALLQQHQQTQQLQLLQLHWQQQQAQVQQAQAKQVQNQLSNLQPQNFTLLNEQQQQLAVFRGIVQATSACTEALKQSDLDYSNFAKSHHSVCEDSHQLPAVSQVSLAPINCQAVPDQSRAGDVKLFGQSLLSQPTSSNQHPNGKVSSPSLQVAVSAPPSGLIAGKSSANTALQLPADALIRGPGWQQIAWPAAHCVSSGLSSVSASSSNTVGTRGAESEQHSGHEAVGRRNERFIREAKCKEDGGPLEGAASIRSGKDIMALSSTLLDTAKQHVEPKRPENDTSSDHGIPASKCREQELSQIPLLAGGHPVSQGLPRVLDALVALAEWRLQNVNGDSGRLTDEFLSQSWEALQRDPGSLVEASKAGGSLAQMCTGSGEMLQHLKDNLSSFPGSNGGVLWAGSSGQSHLSDAQNILAQTPSVLRIHSGEAGILEVRDIDGRGGAAG